MGERSLDGAIAVRIPYERPYRYDLLVDFLRFRAIKGVEVVDESGRYARRTRLLFDTDCDPSAVSAALADFHARVDGRYRIEGVRLPCSFEPFEMSVRAILGQQISVKAANTLAGRVADEFGVPCEVPVPGLSCVFPSAPAFLGARAIGAPRRHRAACTGHLLARPLASRRFHPHGAG